MRKRRLNIDELSIESFETDALAEPRGTVEARQTGPFEPVSCACATDEFISCPFTCGFYSCEGNTCAATCNPTCGASCNGTCGYTCEGTCFGDLTCTACQTGPTAPC